MAKPRFVHRRIDDRYHSFCLCCFRPVDSQKEADKLTAGERLHVCDPHDILSLESVRAVSRERRRPKLILLKAPRPICT
jgi:hypothetical protein